MIQQSLFLYFKVRITRLKYLIMFIDLSWSFVLRKSKLIFWKECIKQNKKNK